MSSSTEKIKEKLDIAEVIGSYIKLDRAGSSLKAKCPFHNEKTPSFFVSPERGGYYCFGCGAKGDMFTFVQEFEGIDFMGALKILAEKAGVELAQENPSVRNEREKLYYILELATSFYEKELVSHSEALSYIQGRGLKDSTIKEFRIGFALDEWRSLYDYLISKKVSASDMGKVGLIKEKEGGGYYDTFRGRIIFPIFDTSKRVIGFSGRTLKKDDNIPKYLNSPDTVLFNKSETLYGLHAAIRKKDYSILVEGQMDLVMCHQGGYLNAVASSGTALTSAHLIKLKRLSNRIIMAFDPDNAGFKAADRAAQTALSMGMEVKVAELVPGADPADMIKTDPVKWKDIIKDSKHLIEFHLRKLGTLNLDQRKISKELEIKVLPLIEMLDSTMEKSYFVAMASKTSGIKEDAIWDDLKKINKKKIQDNSKQLSQFVDQDKKLISFRKGSAERRLMGVIFKLESEGKTPEKIELLISNLGRIAGALEYDKVRKTLEALKDELVFETEAYYGVEGLSQKGFDEIVYNYEEEFLKKKASLLMDELAKAEKAKQPEDVRSEILKNYQEVKKQIEELKKINLYII
jgi:DNA primase